MAEHINYFRSHVFIFKLLNNRRFITVEYRFLSNLFCFPFFFVVVAILLYYPMLHQNLQFSVRGV